MSAKTAWPRTKNLRKKYELPFLLLSDPELSCIQAYDVWQEKKNYGKVSMGVVRTTYLINEEGVIEKVFGKVKAEANPEHEIIELKLGVWNSFRGLNSQLKSFKRTEIGELEF